MKSKKILCLILLVAAFSFFPLDFIFARMESSSYVIWADVFNSGGTEDGSSSNYKLQDSVGEGVILSSTSTSDTYGIKAGFREMYPDAYIIFSLGNTSLDLGTLSISQPKTASHTMTIETNATNGFSITMTGNSLGSGANDINSIGATPAASIVGYEQFGINLVTNSSPAVGANPSGTAPIGSAANHYNQSNYFAFQSGNTVATSSVAINQTVFTVSYLANMASNSVSGSYSTTLTYSATANY
ncbi:MAG: hypothetical protein WCX71_04590 [Candidatus Buchananbacteria bacterium]